MSVTTSTTARTAPQFLFAAADGPDQPEERLGLRLRVPAAVTGDRLSIHEGVLAPGEAVPPHTHDGYDQLLYVQSGSVRVTVGDEIIDARVGDFVVKPRGVRHGFVATGDEPARALELTLSPDFERFVEAMDSVSGPDQAAEVQQRFGVIFDG